MRIKNIKKLYNINPLFVIININNTNNNIIITVTDNSGNTLFYMSSGSSGFKGKKKNTIYAMINITEYILNILKNFEIKNIKIKLKGFSLIKEFFSNVIKLYKFNFRILYIEYNNCKPYNGCRIRKSKTL